jgi:hypothetical protein
VREPRPPKWPGQPIKHGHAKLAPEEALFRSAGAPPRYEETDTYFAHENLPANALPPSELVKAVHHYASHYYEVEKRAPEGRGQKEREHKGKRSPEGQKVKEEGDTGGKDTIKRVEADPADRRLIDERSMDETALLAFGILLEEAGRAVLGRNGALVLTEAADGEDDAEYEEEEDAGEKQVTEKHKKKKSKKRKLVDVDG